MLSMQDSTCCVIVVQDSAVLLVRDESGYGLFDPHSCNRYGRHCANGRAGLFIYPNLDLVFQHIYSTYDYDHPFVFDISCIHVVNGGNNVANTEAVEAMSQCSSRTASVVMQEPIEAGLIEDDTTIGMPIADSEIIDQEIMKRNKNAIKNAKRRERYKNKSDEQKREINLKKRERRKETKKNSCAEKCSKERKRYQDMKDKINKRKRDMYHNMTPVEKEIKKKDMREISRKIASDPTVKDKKSQKNRDMYENMTPVEKEIRKKDMRETSREIVSDPIAREKKGNVNRQRYQSMSHGKNENMHNIMVTSNDISKFESFICTSPTNICNECLILMYDNNVHNVNIIEGSDSHSITVCGKCKKYVEKGEIAPWGWRNDMDPGIIPTELIDLNSMEIRLISQMIPFVKIVRLPGGQLSEIGQAISFPVKIPEIHTCLPRNVVDSGLFFMLPSNSDESCLEMRQEHIVRYDKVCRALDWLQKHNSLYANIEINNMPMCEETNDSETIDVDQFPIRESCAIPTSHTQPNVDIQDILNKQLPKVTFPKIETSPASIFKEHSLEELGFPHLYPYGSNGFLSPRISDLTDLKYFLSRILSSDSRWRDDIGWLFWSLNTYEIRKLYQTISIVCRMKIPQSSRSGNTITAGDVRSANTDNFLCNSYAFMKNIRGTAAYWREELHKLLSKINTLGAPTWFLTLSADDLHWPDLFMILDPSLSHTDAVNMSSQDKWTQLTKNPVYAAIHFDRRVHALFKFILNSKKHPLGKINDFWCRVEIQNRGSPHLHCFLWIEGAPDIETVEGIRAAPSFIDRYVSTTVPTNDEELAALVLRLQIHHHRDTCRKRGCICRFHFPRDLSTETRLKTNIDVTTSSQFYVTKRNEGDEWVNAYNPTILGIWKANMDLQMVGSKYAAAYYVCAYVSKAEPDGLKASLANLLKSMPPGTSKRQQLGKIGNLVLSHRQISAQEVAFRMCGLPLVRSSRVTIWINAHPPSKRCRLLKPLNEIQELDAASADIFVPGISEYYSARPMNSNESDSVSAGNIDWEKMCLAVFATSYTITNEKPKKSDRALPSFKLHNMEKWAKQKRKQGVIHSSYLTPSDGDDYYYHLLYLYLPWRNETEIIGEFQSANEAFSQKHSLLDANIPSFCITEVSRAIQQMHLLSSDLFNSIAANIAPNTADMSIPNELDQTWILSNAEIATQTMGDSSHRPETDLSNIHDSAFQWESLATYTMSSEEFNEQLQSLSPDQSEVFKIVQNHFAPAKSSDKSLRLFVTGGAGSGKSFVIKLLREYLLRTVSKPGFPCVIVTAPTGVASYLIQGQTVHSAFSLPIEHGKKGKGGSNYLPLSNKKLTELRAMFLHIHTVIIDEISMISCKTFEHIHLRLNEIKDTSNDQNSYFGNINIFAFGDLYQLKPVFGPYIFKDSANLSDFHLWKSLFYPIFLTSNHRQSNDSRFTELLNNVRLAMPTNDDLQLLFSRLMSEEQTKAEPFHNALRIFPTRLQCQIYNDAALQNLVETTGLQIIHIKADITLIDGPPQYDQANMDDILPSDASDTAGLLQTLNIAIGSRVMLIRNIMCTAGLVNGARGYVVDFKWPSDNCENRNDQPCAVYVKFDDPNIGKVESSAMF